MMILYRASRKTVVGIVIFFFFINFFYTCDIGKSVKKSKRCQKRRLCVRFRVTDFRITRKLEQDLTSS